MQRSISKERLFELFELLSPSQQRTVVAFIDSLLGRKPQNKKREKVPYLIFPFGMMLTSQPSKTPSRGSMNGKSQPFD